MKTQQLNPGPSLNLPTVELGQLHKLRQTSCVLHYNNGTIDGAMDSAIDGAMDGAGRPSSLLQAETVNLLKYK